MREPQRVRVLEDPRFDQTGGRDRQPFSIQPGQLHCERCIRIGIEHGYRSCQRAGIHRQARQARHHRPSDRWRTNVRDAGGFIVAHLQYVCSVIAAVSSPTKNGLPPVA